LAKFDLKAYARHGAEHRLREIREELSRILRRFPDLQAPRRAPASPVPPNELAALGGREKAVTASRPRRRWKMSAAQKKAVGLRMKKYWAARRAAKK
jgi:hypothetical protein